MIHRNGANVEHTDLSGAEIVIQSSELCDLCEEEREKNCQKIFPRSVSWMNIETDIMITEMLEIRDKDFKTDKETKTFKKLLKYA